MHTKAYDYWLNDIYFDELTKDELRSIAENPKEIEDRFYKNLDFGTGGLRGILGAGTNRMNIYTVRKATQGIANYILKQSVEGARMGVAIAYDSRRFSAEFAEQAALVLNGNRIKAYVFDALRPTPELSFAVRRLGCVCGIVITASHNPKNYNGYKVYWSDGGQVTYPRDQEIIEEVNAITDFSTVRIAGKTDAERAGLFVTIGEDIDRDYIAKVKEQSVRPDISKEFGEKTVIVYTPLNGSGNVPVRRVLKEMGFSNVFTVSEQESPDPDFTTLDYPNPEDPKAFALALKLATEKNSDIILATDPDCDRLGCVAKNSVGAYEFLTGNMLGILMEEYLLSRKQKAGALPKNGAVISTVVSTELARIIAESYGVTYMEVLTGFKYIGEKIKEFEENNGPEFIFGFEESYGYLAGSHSRDKDAVVSSMILCEMAAFYKSAGKTLVDALNELYEKYGWQRENVESVAFAGVDGQAAMRNIMASLRSKTPAEINGQRVSAFRDYKEGSERTLSTGIVKRLNLPVSDVLYFELEDNAWFCVRPSGTEPKIKIYFGVKGETALEAEAKLSNLRDGVMDVFKKARI